MVTEKVQQEKLKRTRKKRNLEIQGESTFYKVNHQYEMLYVNWKKIIKFHRYKMVSLKSFWNWYPLETKTKNMLIVSVNEYIVEQNCQ
jgi:hypothetical protein